MNKILGILFLFIALSANAQQQKPIITVLDLQTNNFAESDMKSIISYLAAELFETGAYTVIDSGQRDALLDELQFSLSGCTDESCQLEVGKMLAAEFVVVGDIGTMGEKIVLTLRVLNTETSETVNTAKSVYVSMTELVDDLRNIAFRIANRKDLGLNDMAKRVNEKRQLSKTNITGIVLMGGVFFSQESGVC